MTTMDRDACENLGILAMFDSMFRPAAALASQPDEEPDDEETVCCEGCGEPLDIDSDRCSACQKADWERDDYGRDDRDDRVCGPLYDGN